MDYIDSLLIMEDDDQDGNSTNCNSVEDSPGSGGSQHPPTEPTPDWRKCRLCQPMAHEVENKCCGNTNFTTTKRRFQKLCLDPEVLQLCIKNRADIRNDREDNSLSAFC